MVKYSINHLMMLPVILILLGILLFIYGYIALAHVSGAGTPFFPLFAFFLGIILIPIGIIGLIFLKIKRRKTKQ